MLPTPVKDWMENTGVLGMSGTDFRKPWTIAVRDVVYGFYAFDTGLRRAKSRPIKYKLHVMYCRVALIVMGKIPKKIG